MRKFPIHYLKSSYAFTHQFLDPILSSLTQKSEVVRDIKSSYDYEENEFGEFTTKKRTPKDSHLKMTLDLENNQSLRRSLKRSNHKVLRVGRMFEDLEAFGMHVAYEHSEGLSEKRPISILCAFMNRIETPEMFSFKRNIEFEGKCVWTGRSSMKIWASMKQKKDDGKEIEVGTFFTMVARDIIRNKGVEVHELVPETAEEITLNKRCQNNDGLHKLMLNLLDIFRIRQGDIDDIEKEKMNEKISRFGKIENGITMKKTKYKVVQNMHPSCRNFYDKILAGYLLKFALDIAYVNGYLYCSSVPSFVALDENAFLKPIHVGQFVQFVSRIVYSEGNAFTVRTDVYFLDAVTKVIDIINVLHTTYVSKNHVIPQIIPESFEELLMYEEGKRIQEKIENQIIIKRFNKINDDVDDDYVDEKDEYLFDI